jgi:hypothetical protein
MRHLALYAVKFARASRKVEETTQAGEWHSLSWLPGLTMYLRH